MFLAILFVLSAFAFGIVLREYTLPRWRNVRDWAPPVLLLVIAIGCGSAVYHGRPETFTAPLIIAALIGFCWVQLNQFAKRWVLPRLRPYMPYIIIGMAFALFAAFVNKSTFFLSAFVVGTLFVLFGGLIKYALRLIK